MEWLATVHSLVRWAVILVGFYVGVKGVFATRAGAAPARGDVGAFAGFVGLLDLEWLLGLAAYLVLHLGATDPLVYSHAAAMTLAVVLAHVMRARQKRAAGREASSAMAFGALAPLAVIGAGHLFLPVG